MSAEEGSALLHAGDAAGTSPLRATILGRRDHPAVVAVLGAYTAVVIVAEIGGGDAFTPWHVVTVLTVLALWALPLPGLVWQALCYLYVGFAFLELAPAKPVLAAAHALWPVHADTRLTGVAVPAWLQAHLHAALQGWPTMLLCAVYLLHFIAPPLAALWLWLRRPAVYPRFLLAYLLCMCGGFLVYLAFPEVPPWIAAQRGLVPPVHRDMFDFMQLAGLGGGYTGADPEPLGAMPALHVTVPLVVAIGLISGARTRWRWLWLGYPLVVSFAAMELGEHYLVDVGAGLLLACACTTVACAVERSGAAAWRSRAPGSADTGMRAGRAA